MHTKTVFLAMSDKLAVLWKAGKTLFINILLMVYLV